MTTLSTALARIATASRFQLERLCAGLYDRHAERCETCCVLGGKFCRTGRLFSNLAEALETEQLW